MGFAMLKDAAVRVLYVGSKAHVPHSSVRTLARQYAFDFDVNASMLWSAVTMILSLGRPCRLCQLSRNWVMTDNFSHRVNGGLDLKARKG
jgi:hypothetical protein